MLMKKISRVHVCRTMTDRMYLYASPSTTRSDACTYDVREQHACVCICTCVTVTSQRAMIYRLTC